jgi:hypothetical protein
LLEVAWINVVLRVVVRVRRRMVWNSRNIFFIKF